MGCQKTDGELIVDRIDIGESSRINRIVKSKNDQLYVLGGERWSSGFVFQSVDGGSSWAPISIVNDTADFFLTDLIELSDAERICVGYGGQIIYTPDNWSSISFVRHQSWEQFERLLVMDEGQYLIAGGGDYSNGIVITNEDAIWWQLTERRFPMRVMDLHPKSNTEIIAFGFAGVYITDINFNAIRPLPLTGEIFTGASFPNDNNIGYICGFNGSILKIDVESESFTELVGGIGLVGPVRMWNTIDFWDDNTGIVAGHDGKVWWTDDAGETWAKYEIPGRPTVQSIVLTSPQSAILGGNSGYLAKIRRP